jgi:hypothetical protein
MIEIIWPGAGANLCNAFLAWGGSDADRKVGGYMELAGFRVAGVTVQNPGQFTPWMIQFNNVPDGAGYTLVVKDTGGASAECTELLVDHQYCPQQQPFPP